MAGVVAQGELVQMVEDFGLQAPQHMLARPAHAEEHQPAGQCAHDIDHQHAQHQPAQAGDVGVHRRAWAAARRTSRCGRGWWACPRHRRVGRRHFRRRNRRRHFCGHCGRQVTIHSLPQQFGRDNLGPGVQIINTSTPTSTSQKGRK